MPARVLAEPVPKKWRHHAPVVGTVLLAHLAAGWALMRVDAVRPAMAEAAPLYIDWIAAPPVQPAPPPEPVKLVPPPKPVPHHAAPPKPVPRAAPPKPARMVAAAPAPAPAPSQFEVPAPPETALPPPMAAVEPAPEPPAAPAPQPKTVSASAVRYLEAPAPVYPAASRRRSETGRVVVRLLIDAQGVPRESSVQQSSSFARLDESALAAVRGARFVPYTEDGVAQAVWVLIPIVFNLE